MCTRRFRRHGKNQISIQTSAPGKTCTRKRIPRWTGSRRKPYYERILKKRSRSRSERVGIALRSRVKVQNKAWQHTYLGLLQKKTQMKSVSATDLSLSNQVDWIKKMFSGGEYIAKCRRQTWAHGSERRISAKSSADSYSMLGNGLVNINFGLCVFFYSCVFTLHTHTQRVSLKFGEPTLSSRFCALCALVTIQLCCK